MEDIRCTQCNRVLGKKMLIRYGEIKCPRCGAINIIDNRNLTTIPKQPIMNYKLKSATSVN